MSRLALSRWAQLVVGEPPEPLGLLPLRAVVAAIAGHGIVQVRPGQRVGLQREVLVGAQVVDPQVARPRRLAGWPAVEEQHVGLDPLGVEHAGGQPQQGVRVALVEQPAADGLAGAARWLRCR